MYINKTCGCVLTEPGDIKSTAQIKGLLDVYTPETSKSALWKYWKATFDPKLCLECASRHGKIYVIDEILDIEPPLHPNCRCIIDRMDAVVAGGATKDGENGADYWLVHYGQLPDYYIQTRTCVHWDGETVKLLKNMHQEKCISAENTVTKMGIFPLHLAVSGMKQILIIMRGDVMVIDFCFLMMA